MEAIKELIRTFEGDNFKGFRIIKHIEIDGPPIVIRDHEKELFTIKLLNIANGGTLAELELLSHVGMWEV